MLCNTYISHSITINKKEAMSLKDNKKVYVEWFRGKEVKGEMV